MVKQVRRSPGVEPTQNGKLSGQRNDNEMVVLTNLHRNLIPCGQNGEGLVFLLTIIEINMVLETIEVGELVKMVASIENEVMSWLKFLLYR